MTEEQQLAAQEQAPASGPDSPEAERVLVIFPHPDDAEFSCGGTMARWAAEGKQITLCIVTNGDRGSDDPEMTPAKLAEIRHKEQLEAARILGVKDVIFMGRQDGTIVHDLDLRRDLTRIARQVRPDVVITDDPSRYWFGNEYINHPDHRATAEAALAAAFPAAGNRLYFPELLVEGLEPYKIKQFYVSSPVDADTFVDITDYMDTKVAALRAHASQMGDWDPKEAVCEWATASGKRRNPPVTYAEDFKYFQTSG
jgi:LmbE family N-acetylglucosaminyl deacetylase